MKPATTMCATLALSAAALSPAGAELDARTPLLCAATTVVVCERPARCVSGPPEEANLPVFWHLDPVAKRVASKRVGGAERSSPTAMISASGEQLVVQGAEDGLGWSMSIERATGRMVLTGGRDLGYLVFGECTTP